MRGSARAADESCRLARDESRASPHRLLPTVDTFGDFARPHEPGVPSPQPAHLRVVGNRAELCLELAAAHEIERLTAELDGLLHHGPGHELGGPIPAIVLA